MVVSQSLSVVQDDATTKLVGDLDSDGPSFGVSMNA